MIKTQISSKYQNAGEKLRALREWLREQGLDGFLVPMTDEYQNEYLPASAKRMEWLTGFSGSAGMAVVLQEKAAVFVDGRYTLQAGDEIDSMLYEIHNSTRMKPEQWVAQHLGHGKTLGYDPWLHTHDAIERLRKECERAHIALTMLEHNPIDALWKNRPALPCEKAVIHPLEYAGEASYSKRQRIAAILREKKADAALLTAPDSVMWLLNIRGNDVPMTPFALCYSLIDSSGGVQLYIDTAKISKGVRAHLGEGVEIRTKVQMREDIDMLGEARRSVICDPDGSPVWFAQALAKAGAKILFERDPCALPKACKNDAELQGMRHAHLRDGLAVVRFLCWLNGEIGNSKLEIGITEMQIADKLESFRARDAMFRGLSFNTIAGAGAHGAIVHYRASEKSNRTLQNNSLLLLDSGAQYPDGTTDITRTIAIGNPTPEMKDRFTRVLKGHIALATARFPEGTSGSQLDGFARRPLWEAGLDYDHGTGHGVGSYLSVHEGPQRISKRGNDAALQPGMVLSNEPGYYKEGDYGIRIENLVVVKKLEIGNAKLEKPFLFFETLTLVPIDTNCIETALLTQAEKDWLNAYHQRVYEAQAPQLQVEEEKWLKERCAPV